MTNTKTTKRALFASVLSLLLCISMLIGSTFAWFTDTATTGVNKIQAGTLDIALEMYDEAAQTWVNAEGKTLDFIKAEGAEDEEILWEPGCTYKLPDLRIVNNGNLHLKYMLTITGIDGDAKLNEAIEWTYGAYTMGTEYVALAPKAYSETITIQGHMKEEAGNEYQGLSIEGISITVFATQLNVENDSFGPNYDKNAPTLFMIGKTRYETLAAAIAAAKDGETIKFSGVITLPTDGTLKGRNLTFEAIDESVSVVDMKNVATGQSTSGATLTFKGVEVVFDNTANYKGIQHAAKVVYEDCTIYGKQFMYAPTVEFKGCEFINYMDYCVWTYGATAATFTDCTFTTGGKAILVYNEGTTDDTVTVEGCTFNSNGQIATDKAAVETGINTADSKHTLIINNSTANGFAANNSTSPLWGNKNNMDGDHLNVTVDGTLQDIVLFWNGSTSAVSEVVENKVEINSPAELAGLAAAVNAGKTYEGVTVVLAEDMDLQGIKWTPIGNSTNKFMGNLDGQGHTVSNLNVSSEKGAQGLIGFAGGTLSVTNLTINNASVDSTDHAAVGAFVGKADGAKITFNNLTLTGDVKLHAKSGQIGGILGNNPNGSVYASNITVDVNEGSYVSTEGNMGKYYDYIGGVFGQIWGATFENITSNIDVITDYGLGAGGISGGATGTWTNISCSGDVTVLYTDNAVWYSNTNANGNSYGKVKMCQGVGTVIGYHGNVTYTNCTSTGALLYKDTGSTNNGMTWITSNSNGVAVQDNRFGCSRWKNDNTVTIND